MSKISFLYKNLVCGIEEESSPADLLCRKLSLPAGSISSVKILRKGIDARKKGRICFVYTISFDLEEQFAKLQSISENSAVELWAATEPLPLPLKTASRLPVLVVGMGPAGLFAAKRLLDYGLRVILIERGDPADLRKEKVDKFWNSGELDTESNVQFGEGGAGTFSDGKLTTRIRDQRIGYVMDSLVEFGAPEDIRFLAKPHVGTDKLIKVIMGMRNDLTSRGVDVRFHCRLTGVVVDNGCIRAAILNDKDELRTEHIVLAPGNSARDTFSLLEKIGVNLQQKPFAVGVRVEHPRELINNIQYGFRDHPMLNAAEYALTYNNSNTGRAVYSFCNCPGGYVIAAASEKGGVVVNGMSCHARDASFTNSALVVSVRADDFPTASPLAGVDFQRSLEKGAFKAGGGSYAAPAQNLVDFVLGENRRKVNSSYTPAAKPYPLQQILPDFVTEHLREAILSFDRKMRGFYTEEATLTAVETRTSSPVRIVRGGDLQSISLQGLYPAGEGAGYAGGITSAAVDGMRAADAVAQSISGN